jgi:hypothetical protein
MRDFIISSLLIHNDQTLLQAENMGHFIMINILIYGSMFGVHALVVCMVCTLNLNHSPKIQGLIVHVDIRTLRSNLLRFK